MKDKIGILLNRLTVGFVFAFVYQIVIGIATAVLGLDLSGDIKDLFLGIERSESEQGIIRIAWWMISTLIITGIALVIVKYKNYLSPYKNEKDINIPQKITIVTGIILGAIISALLFLTDLVIGFFVDTTVTADVQAIYEAALNGNFVPLGVSILFAIFAGFIVVGVASRTAKVKQITKDIGLSNLGKLITKNKVTKTSQTFGLHPGALVHVGEKKVEKVTFSIIEYDEDNFFETKTENFQDCLDTKEKEAISWINVSGIHDAEIIETFGKYFDLHPLVQSDIMNTELRPKIEFNDNYIFIILKMPHFDLETGKLLIEQISVVLGNNYVLTFQETEGDIFDPIRKRIRDNIGQIRQLKSDYLAYALTDALVDNYYIVMEKLGETTELLEEELMTNPSPHTLQTIHSLKRQLITLRKTIWPVREVVDSFERSTSPLLMNTTKTYLRDVYGHSIQVMDTLESLRDMVGGMLDTYLSSVSNKMNEVMKTLTIIASIFIPITFIAGIYGTNFEYIPELSWSGSYFTMIGVMFIIVILMLVWFKKRQWL